MGECTSRERSPAQSGVGLATCCSLENSPAQAGAQNNVNEHRVVRAQAGASYALSNGNDYRMLRFWWIVGPIILQYKYALLLSCGDEDERERRFEKLHKEYARKARELVEDFGGLFVKVAQAISTRSELAPIAYVTELRKLQSDAPPACWEPIRQTLEGDLRAPLDQVFDQIEMEPLGCASIGQAHKVVWHGRDAVVKVQYPGVRNKIRSDLASIQALCKLANPEALLVLKRVAEQFERELDYTIEQVALSDLHRSINASSEFSGLVVVPAPLPELTSGRVIGMEYLPGGKLETALRERLEALGINVGQSSLKEFLMQQARGHGNTNVNISSSSEASSSSSPGSGKMRQYGRALVRWIGFDTILKVARATSLLQLWCKHRCRGRAPLRDLSSLLNLVVRVHGYQIFFCPVFNADPHPGNILLLPDGRVGLIDFGFCTKVEPATKTLLAKLFVTVAESPPWGVCKDADGRVAAAVRDLGIRSERNTDKVLALFPRLTFCKIQPQWLDRKFVGEIMKKDPIVDIPLPVIMAARCAGLLRGLCLGLQENVSVADVWRPYAERWLRENQ